MLELFVLNLIRSPYLWFPQHGRDMRACLKQKSFLVMFKVHLLLGLTDHHADDDDDVVEK